MRRCFLLLTLVFLILAVVPALVAAQSSNCVTVDGPSCPDGSFRKGGGTLYNPDGTTRIGSLCCTPVCGDGRREGGERCERDADCGSGYSCKACACVAKPPEPPAVEPGNVGPSIIDIMSQAKDIKSIEQLEPLTASIDDQMYGEQLPALPSPVSALGPGERAYYRKQCLDGCEGSVKQKGEHCEAMREKLRLFIVSIQGLESDVQSARYRAWMRENEPPMRRACEFNLRDCQRYCFKRIPSLPGEKAPKAAPEKPSVSEEEAAQSGPSGPPASSDVDEETRKALEQAFGGEKKEEKKGIVSRVVDVVKSIFSFFSFGRS